MAKQESRSASTVQHCGGPHILQKRMGLIRRRNVAKKEASKRGTVVTELLRVVVIPEWLRSNGVIPKQEIPKE